MGLESATYLQSLNVAYPEGSDLQSQGDDHIRLIKSAVKNTFPDATKAFYFPKVSAEKTSNFSISLPEDDNTLFPVDATSAAVTATLGAGGVAGQKVTIVKSDSSANAVTISGTILGSGSSLVLRFQGSIAQLVWDHTETRWNVLLNDRIDRAGNFSLTSNTTLTIAHDRSDIKANATSAGFTITLPSSGIPTGYWVRVQKSDSSANIVVVGSYNLYIQYESIVCVWDGSGWIYYPVLWSSNADVWAGNVDRGLRASDLADASAIQTLTYDSPSAAWSWTGGFVRQLALAGNTELANPSGGIPGQYRTIILKGTDSTEREITFGNQFGGVLPSLDDITSTKWYGLTVLCITSSHFVIVGVADVSPAA